VHPRPPVQRPSQQARQVDESAAFRSHACGPPRGPTQKMLAVTENLIMEGGPYAMKLPAVDTK
jgi:hypothetical protein